MATKFVNIDCLELRKQTHPTVCPSCKSNRFKKNGTYKGNQRYQCKTCGKHYRQSTNSSTHGIHNKNLVSLYIQCMEQGLSLRKTAKEIGISLNTAFRWRHKLLSHLQTNFKLTQSPNRTLSIYRTRYSEKGKRIKSDRHHKETVFNYMISDNFGRVTIQTKNYTNKLLPFCTSEFIPDKALSNTTRKGKLVVKQSSQTQKIHNQIEEWLNRFKGVASKYLNHYWMWFSYISNTNMASSSTKLMLYQCI
jgi:transposase-like protein